MPLRMGQWSAASVGIAVFLALQGHDGSLSVAWLALVLAAAVAAWRDEIDLTRPPDRLEWALLAFLLGAALVSVFGLSPQRSFSLSVPVLGVIPLWILMTRARCAPAVTRVAPAALLVAALTQLLLVAVAAYAGTGASPGAWVRSAGASWLVVPNDLAWLGCLLPFVAVSARSRVVLPATTLTVLLLALWLHSLTLLAGAVLSVTLFLTMRRRGQLPSLAWVATGAVGIGGAVMLAALWLPSLQARVQLWRMALRVFVQHPFGVGLHNFVLAYREASPLAADALVDPRRTPWPHNLPLEILSELGVMGFALGGLVVWAVWQRLRRLPRQNANPLECAVAAALLALAALCITEVSLLRLWVWVLGTTLLGLLAVRTAISGEQG